jgi:anti-sigma B factor antagonist
LSLRDAIRDLSADGKKKLLLNLAGVNYVDSSGIGELIANYTTVSRQGGQLKLLKPDRSNSESVGESHKLLTVFDVYENESEALKEFPVGPAKACLRGLTGREPAYNVPFYIPPFCSRLMIHRAERRLLFSIGVFIAFCPLLGLHTILANVYWHSFSASTRSRFTPEHLSITPSSHSYLSSSPLTLLEQFLLGRPLRIPDEGVELLTHPAIFTGDY